MAKLRVGLLFGGRSAEHEVSLQSAKNVLEAMDKDRYEVVLIGIDKRGQWRLNEAANFLLNENNPRLIALNKGTERLALVPGGAGRQLVRLSTAATDAVDVVFPLLHGPYGEDGSVQGFLKLADAPFVGAGILGSAVGMDKDVMKRLLRDAGLPIARFLAVPRAAAAEGDFDAIARELGLPLFVKPANLGSSVGIHRVTSRADFAAALRDAFQFDNKVIVEECIVGRELECAVLGVEQPAASVVGEVLTNHEFYSYEAKYIDEHGAVLEIPARLPPEVAAEVRAAAIRTFQVLCCEGLARVDFFLRGDREIIVNEINTMPGFTRISMYPKLWEATGVPYAELIDRLIQLALDRHKRDADIKTSID